MRTSPNRMTAVIIGGAFIVIGLVGFLVTADAGAGLFTPEGGRVLGIFEVNVSHNIAHLLLGLVLFGSGLAGVRAAKTMNVVIGGAYLLLGIAGLFLVSTPANFLAINAPDNVLHFASAVLLLGVGLGAERTVPSPVA